MSGYTDDALLRRGIDEGAAFIQKPFHPTDLLMSILTTLDR